MITTIVIVTLTAITICLLTGSLLRTHAGEAVVPWTFPVMGALLIASTLMLQRLAHPLGGVLLGVATIATLMLLLFKYRTAVVGIATMVLALVGTIAANPLLKSTTDQPTTAAPVIQTEAGAEMPYVAAGNIKASQPLVGSDAVNSEAPASLPNCNGNIESLQEWVACVNGQPTEVANGYKAFINNHPDSYPGGWKAIEAKAAKGDKGQLVIQVFNTKMSAKQAQTVASRNYGKAVLTSNVIQMPMNTAIMNTRGVQSGSVQAFADARPMVRVALTTNAKAAKQGKSSVFIDCKNPQVGITKNVPVPQPQPNKPSAPRVQKPVQPGPVASTTPPPSTVTSTPPTKTETTTPPPSTVTTTAPPETSTVTTTPPPATVTTTPPPSTVTTTPPPENVTTTPPPATVTTTPPPSTVTTTPPPATTTTPPVTTPPPTTPPPTTKTTPPPPEETTTPPKPSATKTATHDPKPPEPEEKWTPAPAPSEPAEEAPPTFDQDKSSDGNSKGSDKDSQPKTEQATPTSESAAEPSETNAASLGFLGLGTSLLLTRLRRRSSEDPKEA